MTPDTLTRDDLRDGCPFCDEWGDRDALAHAPHAHPDEWEAVEYERERGDWASIRVWPEVKDAADEARADESWNEYVLRCVHEPPVELTREDVRRIVREELEEAGLR